MTTLTNAARRITVAPSSVAEFSPDYWDCFGISAQRENAREWAHLSLRGAQSAGGVFSLVVWHGLLGFDLAPPDTPGTLAGWQIADESPTRLTLDVDGRLMAGRMVFDTSGNEATWTTMLRFHHALARPIWGLASYAHRALAPGCLDSARRAGPHRANSPAH